MYFIQNEDFSEALGISLTCAPVFFDHCALPFTLFKLGPKNQELVFAR